VINEKIQEANGKTYICKSKNIASIELMMDHENPGIYIRWSYYPTVDDYEEMLIWIISLIGDNAKSYLIDEAEFIRRYRILEQSIRQNSGGHNKGMKCTIRKIKRKPPSSTIKSFNKYDRMA